QPQSEKVWAQANKYRVPRMAYINKMDRDDANFLRAVETMKARLHTHAMPIQLPVGQEAQFKGIVDLVTMKAKIYKDDLGKEFEITDVPADMKSEADKYRALMIEKIAETSDELTEKFLEGTEFTEDEIRGAIRKGTIEMKFTPVLCGSSFKNKGVQMLLDAIVDYMPSPVDVPAIKGENSKGETEVRESSDAQPFAGLAFKIATDPFVGRLCFFRVYSGTIQAGSYVYNSTKDKKERAGRIVQMHANKREEITEIHAGDIAAIIGLKDTITGDTLCDPDKPIVLESMQFAEPVIQLAIEPKTKNDQEKLITALIKLAEEDPTFKTFTDQETNQTIIAGMGELHLEIIVDRLRREFKVEVNEGRPQVAFRETIKSRVEAEGMHKKQTGGHGQYGHCKVIIEPKAAGEGYEFVDKTVGGSIPKEYIPAVDQGIQDAMAFGPLAGYPLEDVKVTLLDGQSHDVDSSELAFRIAGSMALKKAAGKADPVLLEPLMAVEVTTREDFLGAVIGDINSRRGHVQGMEEAHGNQIIRALIPLNEMFGYVGDLRSKTSGQASYSMEFHSYAEVPKSVSEEIVAKGHS
ncbi:MAG: elongation factor G, partial [Propionibacteriaceae bacterium]|nr:elongation factor G [Propionibacteriaceae bacterium]